MVAVLRPQVSEPGPITGAATVPVATLVDTPTESANEAWAAGPVPVRTAVATIASSTSPRRMRVMPGPPRFASGARCSGAPSRPAGPGRRRAGPGDHGGAQGLDQVAELGDDGTHPVGGVALERRRPRVGGVVRVALGLHVDGAAG